MTTNTVSRWQRLTDFSSREHFLIGASVFRVLAGLAILYQYLINYGQRNFLFGPSGIFPYEHFLEAVSERGFSLYSLSSSPFVFELIFHAGIVVAALWVAGWRTRWLTPLNYIFWVSLHTRFDLLWDGGDNVMQLVFVYAMFADVGAYFSFDAERSRRAREQDGFTRRVRAMFHNTAILAIAIQICLVYGIAGLTKVQGETWQNGTSLYYALRGGEFRLPGVSEFLYHNSFLLTALAYSTVAFQISFPFFLFLNRNTRRIALAMGIMFHLGIFTVMGLITFATFLMAVDLTLVTDDEYRALWRMAARATDAGRRGLRRLTARLRGVRSAEEVM